MYSVPEDVHNYAKNNFILSFYFRKLLA